MMPVTDHPADVSQAAPPWRGFHHVALVARDLDATISFYRDVLGMEVVFIAPAGELHGRHGASPSRSSAVRSRLRVRGRWSLTSRTRTSWRLEASSGPL